MFINSFSKEVWETTYKDHNDNDITDNWRRVAKKMASVEDDKEKWENQFYSMLENFRFVPGGRILANAGTEWSGTSYINCFVKDRNKYDLDSLDGILSVLRDQSQTLKSEGGWGCNFSFIRPRGSFIHGIGVETPGAVKYMEMFDKSSDIITAGSGRKNKNKKAKGKIRKGAMMGILSIWHPDIFEFVTSKQTEGRLTKFNISVGIHDDFMEALRKVNELRESGTSKEEIEKADKWDLVFPDTQHPKYKEDWFGDIYDWKNKGYDVVVYNTVSVTELWETIMKSTYNRNDPGVIFLDVANKTHLWNYGPSKLSRILESNPCGEQTLPNGGCCLLGSLNLTQFIDVENQSFLFEEFEKTIKTAIRFMDNVNDVSSTPLEIYAENLKKRRRIGLGIMGWGSALYLLGLRYGSDTAEDLKRDILKVYSQSAVRASVDLAKEKGMFEGCDPEKHFVHPFFKQINLPQEILEDIRKYGTRNSAIFSVQPTGNTGILANNVSGGLEPIFMHEYVRTVICPSLPDEVKGKCPKYWEGEFKETKWFKEKKEGTDDILVAEINGTVYKIDRNRGLTKEVLCEDYAVHILKQLGRWNPDADWAVTTTQLSPDDHIRDMTSWAKYVDSAISKTLNLPNDFPYGDFKNIYFNCHGTGFIKGFTTYRAGTMTSVLKSKDDKEQEETKIPKTKAPKRPKYLPCEVFHLTQQGDRYYVVVGLLEGEPYEVFTGTNTDGEGDPIIPKSIQIGELYKKSRGKYVLRNPDKDYSCLLTNGHSDSSADALTRMISTSLRHGVDISFVVHQLEKTDGDLTCFSRVLARTLKKYIKDGTEVHGETLDGCETPNKCKIVREEGCIKCITCGNSKCG